MNLAARVIVGLLALTVGVVIIVFNTGITSHGILVVGGILFIVAGVLDGALTFAMNDRETKGGRDVEEPTKEEPRRRRGVGFAGVVRLLVCLCAVALGIAVLVTPQTFAPAIPIVFGILVLLGSLMMFYTLAVGVRPLLLPGWLYIMPALMIVAAVLIFVQHSPDEDARVMIYTGIGLGLYGLCCLSAAGCAGAISHQKRHELKEATHAQDEAPAAPTPDDETPQAS